MVVRGLEERGSLCRLNLISFHCNCSGPCPEQLRTGRSLRHSNAPRANTETSSIRPQQQVLRAVLNEKPNPPAMLGRME